MTGPGVAAALALLQTEVAPLVVGESAHDTERLLSKAEFHFREVGFAGAASRAYAALDVALWDAKAKAAGVPLFKLLGTGPGGVALLRVRDRRHRVGRRRRRGRRQGGAASSARWGSASKSARPTSRGTPTAPAVARRRRRGRLAGTGGRGPLRPQHGARARPLLRRTRASTGSRTRSPPTTPPATPASPTSSKSRSPSARPSTAGRTLPGPAATASPASCGPTPARSAASRLLKIAATAEAHGLAVCPVRLPEVNAHLGAALPAVTLIDRVTWCTALLDGGPAIDKGKLTPPRRRASA